MILLITQLGELQEYEGSLVDFEEMGEAAESIVECIHHRALAELLSRSVESMWDWEVRTKNMFENNYLKTLQDVVSLSMGRVNRLVGCGYYTRKEVYEVFCLYHVKLQYWAPEMGREYKRYKF